MGAIPNQATNAIGFTIPSAHRWSAAFLNTPAAVVSPVAADAGIHQMSRENVGVQMPRKRNGTPQGSATLNDSSAFPARSEAAAITLTGEWTSSVPVHNLSEAYIAKTRPVPPTEGS